MRQRERERLANGQNKASLRVAPKRLFKDVVDRLNLASWLGTERAKEQLAMAGYRGAGAEYTFLFFRLGDADRFCFCPLCSICSSSCNGISRC